MKDLTLYESIFLLAIWRLDNNAYGVALKKYVSEVTQKSISYGALYSYLSQLFKKGYVTKAIGDPTPERGGRRKIYYKLSPEGKKALKAARKLQSVIWADIPEFAFDKS